MIPSKAVSSQSIYPVVVNWNLAQETVVCVRSLLAAGAAPGTILVIDNGSGDGSAAHLAAALGETVELIASPANLGFAGGSNLGIRRGLERGAEWLFLVNNDTEVAADFFLRIGEAMTAHPDTLLLAPLIFYYDEPTRIWSLGDRLVPGTLITRSLWRNRLAPANLPAYVPVDFLNACGIFVHRRVFERIGLLDASYFMYAEDVDFCWRAREAGFKLGCCTRAHLWHKVSRSTGIHHPQTRYWRTANQIRFYRQNAGFWGGLLMAAFTLARVLRIAFVDLLHGRRSGANALLRGWRDGWLGR